MIRSNIKKLAAIATGAATLLPAAARAETYDYSTTDTATSGAAAAGIIGVSLIFLLLWFAFIIFAVVYWILMIIDAAKRTNWENESDKTVWLLVIILVGILGAIIYRFVIVSKLGKAGAPKTTQTQAPAVEPAKTEDKK